MITPKELRDEIKKSVELGLNEKVAAHKLKTLEEQAEYKKYCTEADTILRGIPELCRQAIYEGKKNVFVTKWNIHDINYREGVFNYGKDLEDINLRGVAKIVCEKLTEAGIRYRNLYRHDGDGMYSWYELYIYIQV